MKRYRNALPQLGNKLFLTDAGLETHLIFNKGIEIREFAAHTLLASDADRSAMADYFPRIHQPRPKKTTSGSFSMHQRGRLMCIGRRT